MYLFYFKRRGSKKFLLNLNLLFISDQRVSFSAISLLLGASVVLADALQQVPFAVLYGVFLYMGISGIAGIQLFDRLFLMFMPVKHHPRVGYTRRVRNIEYDWKTRKLEGLIIFQLKWIVTILFCRWKHRKCTFIQSSNLPVLEYYGLWRKVQQLSLFHFL